MCRGRFAGCADVWERGTRHETAIRLSPKAEHRSVPATNGSGSQNGHAADDMGPLTALISPETPSRDLTFDGTSLLALSERIAQLGSTVEAALTHAPNPSTEQVAAMRQLLSSIDQLPSALSEALSDALARQHRLVIEDMRSLLRQFLDHLDPGPRPAS